MNLSRHPMVRGVVSVLVLAWASSTPLGQRVAIRLGAPSLLVGQPLPEPPPPFVLWWGGPTTSYPPPNLLNPQGIAVGPNGDVFVSNTDFFRVDRFTPTGQLIASLTDPTDSFFHPIGLTVSPAGDVWVTNNWSSSIVRFDAHGTIVARWKPPGVPQHPRDVVLDGNGFVYVANTDASEVLKFDEAGTPLTSWPTKDIPLGLAADPAGLIYVGTWTGIQKFDTVGNHLADFPTPPERYWGIDLDRFGNVYGVTSNEVLKFSPDGTILTRWGGPSIGHPFGTPSGALNVAVASDGSVYTAERGDHRVQKFTHPPPQMFIDGPLGGAVTQPFLLRGWAADFAAPSGTGVDDIHVWTYPNPGSATPPTFQGSATYGVSRPDVGSVFGSEFTNAGYELIVGGLPPGAYQLVAFAHSSVFSQFNNSASVLITVGDAPQMVVDTPLPGAVVATPFLIAGWAVDAAALMGTGVNTVHVWAFPVGGGAPSFLGVAPYGFARPGVATFLGDARFTNAGFNLTVGSLAPGVYDIGIYAFSTVAGGFSNSSVVRVTVN